MTSGVSGHIRVGKQCLIRAEAEHRESLCDFSVFIAAFVRTHDPDALCLRSQQRVEVSMTHE